MTASLEFDLESPPFPLTAVDRAVLAMKDEDFHAHSWPELKQIIGMLVLQPPRRFPDLINHS
jgi:hypothetical protein